MSPFELLAALNVISDQYQHQSQRVYMTVTVMGAAWQSVM